MCKANGDCCLCQAIGVRFRQGKFQMFSGNFGKGDFKVNPNRRHISVEMEVDGWSDGVYSTAVNRALNKWGDAVVRDGSLNDMGFEINTNPANGDVFLRHIKEICDGLSTIKAKCSTACGLHVHINVKGSPLIGKDGEPILDADGNPKFDPRDAYTHYDLRRLFMLYAVTEKALFELCTPARVNGRYSQICGKYYMTKNTNPKEFRKDILAKMYRNGSKIPAALPGKNTNRQLRQIGAELKEKKRHKYEQVRYKALNAHSFFLRGTIEFRHKEGSVDYKEITNWALICAYIVDKASKMPEKEIKALPKNPREALAAILPKDLQEWAKLKWEQQDKLLITRQRQVSDEIWATQRVNLDEF